MENDKSKGNFSKYGFGINVKKESKTFQIGFDKRVDEYLDTMVKPLKQMIL